MFMRIHLKSSNLCFRVFIDLVFQSLFFWINIFLDFHILWKYVVICSDPDLVEQIYRYSKDNLALVSDHQMIFLLWWKYFQIFFFLFQVNVYIKNPVVTKIRRDQKIPVRHYKKWKLFFLLLANRWFGSSPIREAFLAFAWASAWSR